MFRCWYLLLLLTPLTVNGQSLQGMVDLLTGSFDSAVLRKGSIRIITDSVFIKDGFSGIRRYEVDTKGRIRQISVRHMTGCLVSLDTLTYDEAGAIIALKHDQKDVSSLTFYEGRYYRSGSRIDSILYLPDSVRIGFRYDGDGRLKE